MQRMRIEYDADLGEYRKIILKIYPQERGRGQEIEP